ncbi:hypothetical protein LOK74_23990 [Brevibacillus humidisoli]|uniref:hypothetical protein n=1 Tax=Brevibacillus humidisoli TaxID=2895522 RepID=UPI001E29546F|nr:hypothetical protein [Brevibacillus humidisoli]UFJ40984.1 hypothetical protein LOK74_23990 [Brevibacillus humidisoli]
MNHKFPIFSRLVLAGLLTSAVALSSFPTSLHAQSTLAKSKSREILFASEKKLDDLETSLKSDNPAIKGIKKALTDNKIKVTSISHGDGDNFSEYDSIAYHYKDVKKDKKLQQSLRDALHDGKKVFLYGGLTIEEYCELLGLENIYSQIESDTPEEKIVSFHDSGQAEKKANSDNTNKHEIIGYTLDKNSPYNVFICDINNYDDKGMIDLNDEIYLKEILEHEYKTLKKGEKGEQSDFSIQNVESASTKLVDSEYDITASAYYVTKKAGSINSQYKLYQVTDESDDDYDYFYVKDTSVIETYEWMWDAEEFAIRHELSFSSDELDDAEPDDTESDTISISLGYPFEVSYTYNVESGAEFDLTINKSDDYSKWLITDNDLESDNDDYEVVTSWASTGTYAGMDITHRVGFFAGLDVEAYANQSIEVRYNY